MSNMPKIPGYYPVIAYNEETEQELSFIIALGPLNMEDMKQSLSTLTIYDGRAVIAKIKPEDFENFDLDFGPKINFPKGGWKK